MGQVVRLTWSLLLLGVALSSVSALGSGGIIYLSSGFLAAKDAWFASLSIVFVLAASSVLVKLLQYKSARYYYIGGAILAAQVAVFLYFLLMPVFFIHPAWSFFGGVLVLLMLLSNAVSVQMARRHFLKTWKKNESDLIVSTRGVRGVSVRKFANALNMSGAPSIFNFEPQWLSSVLGVSALGAMFFGFGLRGAFPGISMFVVGCGVVYIGGYMAQWFLITYYKIRIIGELEKKCGYSLVAMDFVD